MRELLMHRKTPGPSERLTADIARRICCVARLPVVARGIRQDAIEFRLVDEAKPLAPRVRQLCGIWLHAEQKCLLLQLVREDAKQVL